jgi:branched-subunit amino acid aminotransferase/4-amino-4-deoxychorismate lyase
MKSERFMPKAKTLNMLESYIAYRKAKNAGAYDALFINREGHAIEGTRTNLFGLRGKTIISPPSERFLDGVTRKHVLEVAQKNGFDYLERLFTVEELLKMDAAFITSTSSNIMPIASIDGKNFKEPVPANLARLMQQFDEFLEDYKRTHIPKK